jgi:hypothetical protein
MGKLLVVLSLSQFDYHSAENTSEMWGSHEHSSKWQSFEKEIKMHLVHYTSLLQPIETFPPSCAPLLAASITPGPPPVMMPKPALASKRAVSTAAGLECFFFLHYTSSDDMLTSLVVV